MLEPSDFSLRKFVAPEFVFGMDARHLAGRYARNFGARRVLVVTDPGVAAAGWPREVVGCLTAAGIESVVFSAVTSNPKSEEVMAGAEAYRREGCNALVAVGGGSPMDCAKGIGIVSSTGRDVLEFEGVDKVDLPGPPLICVPTTAGSAAEVSQFAIINDDSRKAKIAIISKMVVPDVALIDPVTTVTMSGEVTTWTGMDALCHAVEAFVSTAHSPITDVHALQAIHLLTNNLLPVIEQPKNLALRGRVMLASLEAGLAFSNASLGAVHAMAHSLGGLFDYSHGECNAILLPHVVDANFDAVSDRYLEVARAMGVAVDGLTGDEVRGAMTSLLRQQNRAAGLPVSLGPVGVAPGDIPELARRALRDPCIFTNPRQLTLRDIETIYEKAL